MYLIILQAINILAKISLLCENLLGIVISKGATCINIKSDEFSYLATFV